ncbi:MAG: hypothetical protein ABIR32_01010 [Ilumatobacteraceae bacterium]
MAEPAFGAEVQQRPIWRRSWAVVTGLTALLALPLLIAAIALSRKHWSPVLDLAMTEFRVRDVGTRHTPLIGLPGRIGTFPDQGSHPGPLSFYLLAPTYRLFGSGAWALELGSVLIHIAAVGAGLTLAWRRGSAQLTVAVAVMMAVIMRGYGIGVFTQPWNPYMPLIAWIVVLLASWSILEGDAPALVYFVVAGSLCAQTHVPYVAIVGGMGVLVVGWASARGPIGSMLARRGTVDSPMLRPVPMPGAKRWAIIAAAVGFVLWLPPIADQFRHSPGNLRMLEEYFTTPPDEGVVGLGAGIKHLLRHLDLIQLGRTMFTQSGAFTATAFNLDGSIVPGILLLIAWAATAVLAWRLRHRLLIHLHAVIAVGYVLAAIAMSRIFGKLWYYLTLWTWGLLTMCLFAMGWTIVAVIREQRPARRKTTMAVARWGALTSLVMCTLTFSWSGAHATPPEYHLSKTLTAIVGPTADALAAGVGAADGRGGRYVVTWSDAANFGSQGYGLVNELERRGFSVGTPNTWRVPITPQRVIDPRTVTATVQLATGSYIAEWRDRPDAVEVATFDLRSDAQRIEYDKLVAQLLIDLDRLGLDDLIPVVDTNLFGVQVDARVPEAQRKVVNHLLEMGLPTAVFIAPAGVTS